MNRLLQTLAAAAWLAAAPVFAQTRPFDRAVSDNVWLTGTNMAGLRNDMSRNVSYVEIFGGTESGGLRKTWEPSSSWNAGARARTLVHLDRFSMLGGFSFRQTEGKDMCGSMLIKPGYYPIDILEFTPGRKTLQTYAFDGGISIDLAPGWRAGAVMEFESDNYSKRKDLRHTNYRLDMTVSPGLSYTTPSGDLSVGLNYIYSKNSESAVAEQIGTGESSYYAFLDKGLHYGKYEVWSGSGVHLDEAGVQGFPLKEQMNGIGLQVSSRGNMYMDIEYLRGNGSAGEKQSVWYRFPSNNLNLRMAETFDFQGSKVYLRQIWSWKFQTNDETVLEKVVSGGITTTEEYGSNRIFERDSDECRIEMEVVRDGFEYMISLRSEESQSMASQIYPYISEEDVFSYEISFAPQWHRDSFDFGGELLFRKGRVKDNERLVAEDSGVLTVPFQLEDYHSLALEYETASKMGGRVFAVYNLPLGIYLRAEASLLKAGKTSLLPGDRRWNSALTVGLTF